MAFETIIVEIEEHVGLVRLNRPEALNALNSQLLTELGEALSAMDASDDVRAMIVTGSEKAFAAGADIKEMASKGFSEMFVEDYFAGASETLMRVRKPVIAAVSGYCLGGGCELAMMCDFIIAADSAKFGQPEINLGVIPGLGGSQRLTRFVGKSMAMEMCLTGRRRGAAEAERSGLVARVVPAADLLSDAREPAGKIAAKSTLTARAMKEAVNRSYETTLREGLLFERRLFDAIFSTDDKAEGMAAFIEKRPARFRGR
jgi:enoyl-CoA hydratase